MSRSTRKPARQMPLQPDLGMPEQGWRQRLYIIIFESDTVAGKRFDLILLGAIVLSLLVVALDSVAVVYQRHGAVLDALEWFFTALFTLEYVARLACVRRPVRYARSFFGVIDLVSVLPTYLALVLPGAHAFLDIRILRLLRIFRILKLAAYIEEYQMLGQALAASRRKILIFLTCVLMVVILMGTMMYVIEGAANGFTSIPTSVYWAISTVTTVGFGDITPKTDLGRALASAMMLLGWGILAVPTGIISSELTARRFSTHAPTRTCPECLTEGHEPAARFCKDCGTTL
ncbi:ion transporter [Actimicrobium antarcticum]|uniref:Ion transporter n=1 Tax=Actimicrobium antarcticum TaxID=1051899 RepID=A0ABP7TXX2_9BURK